MVKKEDASKKETAEAENEKKFSRFLEEAKLTNDYMKHIATLDTGSILIMVAFLQKSAKQGSEFFVFLAAFAFVTSLTGVVPQRTIVNYVSDSTSSMTKIPSGKEKFAYRLTNDIAYFSFLIAIGILLGFIFYTFFI